MPQTRGIFLWKKSFYIPKRIHRIFHRKTCFFHSCGKPSERRKGPAFRRTFSGVSLFGRGGPALLLGSCWLRGRPRSSGCSRSACWRCRYTGLCVVGIDDSLGDIGSGVDPDHAAILLADIQNNGVTVLLSIAGDDFVNFLSEGLEHLVHFAFELVLGVFGAALQRLLLLVNALYAGATLCFGELISLSLQLLLGRFDLVIQGLEL